MDLVSYNQGYAPHVDVSAYSFDEFASKMSSAYEDVNAIQGYGHNNPYSKAYNPGWQQHPNFSQSRNSQ